MGSIASEGDDGEPDGAGGDREGTLVLGRAVREPDHRQDDDHPQEHFRRDPERRTGLSDGGLFDRLLANLDTIAEHAEGPLTTPEQLDRYGTNADDEIDDDGTEPLEPSPSSATEPSAPGPPADEPVFPDRKAPSERRWPRRAS